jgi:hypothetical protein
MGLAHARVKLGNPRLPELSPIEVEAPADAAGVHLCLSEPVVRRFELQEHEKRSATFADGSRRPVSCVAPVGVSVANRPCFTGAMVPGEEPLLGTIPREDTDLVVLPETRRVVVNPANPNFAISVTKGVPIARPRR